APTRRSARATQRAPTASPRPPERPPAATPPSPPVIGLAPPGRAARTAPAPSAGGAPLAAVAAGPRLHRARRFRRVRGQRARDPDQRRLGLLGDLPPGHAQDVQAEAVEVCIAAAVVLEAVARGVELEAVDLDDESLPAPEEVHLLARDPDVQLRARESRLPDEREEALLGLGARERRPALALEQGAQQRCARPSRMAREQAEDFRGRGERLPDRAGEGL